LLEFPVIPVRFWGETVSLLFADVVLTSTKFSWLLVFNKTVGEKAHRIPPVLYISPLSGQTNKSKRNRLS